MSPGPDSLQPLPSFEKLSLESETIQKATRRERSEAGWNSHKAEIQQLYVEQGMPLKRVMQALENKYGYRFSLRSWKAKMKEWKFEKNLPQNEMAFIASRADKRKADEGKETVFYRGDIKIESERVENFKKRKLTAADLADLPIIVDTPINITYHTPSAISEPVEGEVLVVGEAPIEPPAFAYSEPACQSLAEDEDKDDSAISTCHFRNNTADVIDPEKYPTSPTRFENPENLESSLLDIAGHSPSVSEMDAWSQVIFSSHAIKSLLNEIPARPIALETFLEILRRLYTRSSHLHNGVSQSQELRELEIGSLCGHEFFDKNISFIKESIKSGSSRYNYPVDIAPKHKDNIIDEYFASGVESDLLLLLQNIRAADEYYTKGYFISSLSEIAHATIVYLDLSPYDPSCCDSLDPVIKGLARCIEAHWSSSAMSNDGSLTLDMFQEILSVMEDLYELLYYHELMESAELICRHLVSQISPEDEDRALRAQHRLFKVLHKTRPHLEMMPALGESLKELARLSLAHLAWRFKTGIITDTRNIYFLQAVEASHSIWARFSLQMISDNSEKNEQGKTLLDQVRLVLFDICNISQISRSLRDLQKNLVPKLTLLAKLSSFLGWYDTSNFLFSSTLSSWTPSVEKSLVTLDQVQGHAWHALNLQKQERWSVSVKALEKGYYLLRHCQHPRVTFANFEYLALLLKSAVTKVPPGYAGAYLEYMDKVTDDLLANAETWTRRQRSAVMATSLHQSKKSTHSMSVASTSSSRWTTSSSRYGVTYSEGGLSDVSHNYSALFG